MLQKITIVDKNGVPTGELSDPEDASNRGLWHLSAHATIYTTDGHVLLQRRSQHIQHFPGLCDLSVGGFVDAGETPLQTIIREIHEETGITVDPSDLHYVGITRQRRHWRYRSYTKMSRVFVYNYVAVLQLEPSMHIQIEEVEQLDFITMHQARRLVRYGRLRGYGRLIPHRGYYRTLIATAKNML